MTATNEKSGCLSVIFPFLKRSPKESAALPYRLRDDFLSPAELSFYRILSSIVATRLTIQSKVRLADIFFVARPNENITYFNRIVQKHLDFLVCDSITMKPVFGVELDDASHRRNDRQERDEFVEKVCRVAGLPLLRFPVQREYSTREIAIKIAPYIGEKVDASDASQPEENLVKKAAGSVPMCPKCNIPMVLRVVSQGEHKGMKFYGCQNYPHCREVKRITA